MMNKKQTLLAVVALALSGAASAQMYGVVSVGTSKSNLDCASVAVGAANCDTRDTAFKLLGGYRLAPNWAVEAGYMSFGKTKVSDPQGSLDLEVTAFGLGGAFRQEFAPQWSFVARLGVAQVKTKVDANVSGLGSASESDSNAQLYGGLGVSYQITKQMSIDAAWDATKSKFVRNGLDFGVGNVNAYSLGLTFAF